MSITFGKTNSGGQITIMKGAGGGGGGAASIPELYVTSDTQLTRAPLQTFVVSAEAGSVTVTLPPDAQAGDSIVAVYAGDSGSATVSAGLGRLGNAYNSYESPANNPHTMSLNATQIFVCVGLSSQGYPQWAASVAS
jgi:hypothetical protein